MKTSEFIKKNGQATIELKGDMTEELREVLNELNTTIRFYTCDDRGGWNYTGPKNYLIINGTPIHNNAITRMVNEALDTEITQIFNEIVMKRIRENASKGFIQITQHELGNEKTMPLIIKKIVNTEGLKLSGTIIENDRTYGQTGVLYVSF